MLCPGKMKGMLANDKRSLWYSRLGEFLTSVCDWRKEILYVGGSVCNVRWTNLKQDCEANGIECLWKLNVGVCLLGIYKRKEIL